MLKGNYVLKQASIDPKLLQQYVQNAELDERPNTLKYTTAGGNTLKSPYNAEAINHQKARLGGDEPYYKALAERLQQHGKDLDTSGERAKDLDVSLRKMLKTFGGAAAGGLAGHGLDHLIPGAKGILSPIGAVLGGAYGATRHTPRSTAPFDMGLEGEPLLYSEPDYVKALKQRMDDLEWQNDYTHNRLRHLDD